MNRTDRLLAIILELQAKGWQRAEDLAATFEVSKRTIYRDVQALSESGVPVIASPGQGYTLVEGYFLPPLSFSTDEALVLLLGADYVAQNFDDQYRLAARSAASKIEAILSEDLRTRVHSLQQSLRFVAMYPLDAPAQTEILHLLRRAILQCRRIRLEYHARYAGEQAGGEKNVREADPYGLVHVDRTWYLAAYDHLRQDIRHFRLDRIDHIRLLDKTFTRPADFSMEQRSLAERPITVRVVFDREVARWVREDRSFYTVAEAEDADGLCLTFQVRQERELRGWLLSWGAHVRVIEPDSLRQSIAAIAQNMVDRHKTLLP
jgi:predicted DNA-binding transcriptional regulator YafY